MLRRIATRRIGLSGAALIVGTLVFAGCGSDSGATPYVAPTGPAIKTLSISAKNFAFTPSALSAPAGILQIDLTSSAGNHDLVIQGLPGFQLEVSGDTKASGKVLLKKGKYTFYCDIAGHRSSGMEGTLTVT